MFNKIRKIFNGKKEVIKATEPSSSIKEMVSLLVFLLRNLNCILLWNLVQIVKKSLYVSSNYFVFIFFSSLSTSILLLVIYNTFFQLFQVVDEIQVLQRKGSRKLRQLNFEISKHINPARDAARKERYNKIAQKYQ